MVEISLAPMLKVTTPYFRMLIRKLSPDVILFTEMIVSSTVIHVSDEKLRFLLGNPDDKTVVQIGGSDPEEIAKSIMRLKSAGWLHFNLNCGCPSDRVQNGRFGALLMLEKQRVADIINETHRQTGIVLSLKIRVGVDEHDSFEFFKGFVEFISSHSPCFKFYVHARKCWLQGLSPRQNRNIPPLLYQYVYDLKTDFPHLFISLNGGINENCLDKVQNLDGLMIGRHAWDNIMIFSQLQNNTINIKQSVKEYIEEAMKYGPSNSQIVMPLVNYRKGRSLSKMFKQTINEIIQNRVSSVDIYTKLEPFLD